MDLMEELVTGSCSRWAAHPMSSGICSLSVPKEAINGELVLINVGIADSIIISSISTTSIYAKMLQKKSQ